MRRLIVLTGVRGAGKTTLVKWLEAEGVAQALKPFTTRKRRFPKEAEYHFFRASSPPALPAVAWQIDVGSDKYGMLRSEIDSIDLTLPAVTVFDPENLNSLEDFRRDCKDLEVVIVALDTIVDVADQHQRVGVDAARMVTDEQLVATRKIMREQDITLSGDLDTVKRGLKAVAALLSNRGGVVTCDILKPLCEAGALLQSYDSRQLQSASYDLRVGNEMWCQGQFIDLDSSNDRFSVPPYSYVIVKAMEQITMPSFLVASFDIKVSHFFSGLILSNGPQVDPGYRGDLFCMLFNGNSSPRSLVVGDHFSTIEFLTVTRNTPRYVGPYSFKDKLRSAMPVATASGPGGAIFARIDEAVAGVRKEMNLHQGILLGTAGILSAVVIAVTAFAFTAVDKAFSQGQAATNAAFEANRARASLEDELSKLRTTKPVTPTPAESPPTENVNNSRTDHPR